MAGKSYHSGYRRRVVRSQIFRNLIFLFNAGHFEEGGDLVDNNLTSSAACLVQWQWSVCDEGSLKCFSFCGGSLSWWKVLL